MKLIYLSIKDVLDKKGITRYELSKNTGIEYPVIDRYYKNKVTRYDKYILLKICLYLDCEVGDILKIADAEE